jgi:CheY-like chemotaxis protein
MGQSGELEGRRILVVEDDFLVAQGLCGMLEEAGATIVGPFGWADEALKFVETHLNAFDSAVLDVDLHGEKSSPPAMAPMRSIPATCTIHAAKSRSTGACCSGRSRPANAR